MRMGFLLYCSSESFTESETANVYQFIEFYFFFLYTNLNKELIIISFFKVILIIHSFRYNQRKSIKKMSSKTVQEINEILKKLKTTQIIHDQSIMTKSHIAYCKFILKDFREAVLYFDVAQPWIYYYAVHTLNMLGVQIPEQDKQKVKQAISYCGNNGFAGGYKQLPHLAPTYAAFLTILSIGKQHFDVFDKERLYNFFKSVKNGGRFRMHLEGECDLRGSYIVAIITKMLGLKEDILEGVAQTIVQSQTYEGGISNTIGGQAHGGFTFCGVAAMAIMGKLQELDVSRLLLWLSRRQVEFGGFNGRTNKLIDSCYSFWIGSVFNIINNYYQGKASLQDHLLYCQQDLQKYILLYCQQQKGGLVDKPGKNRDCYHTCYALSGLSLSQQFGIVVNESPLKKIDPIYNVQSSLIGQYKK